MWVFVGDQPGELDRQALSLAQSLGSVELVGIGEASISGAGVVWSIRHPLLTDYAPEAIAEALAQLIGREMPSALIAAGSERGNEVMAHVAALTDLPLASNVVTVDTAAQEDWQVSRVRWGGSLIEEASLSAVVKLLTVAPHSQPVYNGDEKPSVTVFEPELDSDLARTRVTERVTVDEGITLTTAPVVVSGGGESGRAEGFAILEELAGLLGEPSDVHALSRTMVGVHIATRWGRPGRGSPPASTSRAGSRERSSTGLE